MPVKEVTPEYQAWVNMRRLIGYDIKQIDPNWLTDFEAFLADLGEKPEKDYTLLRRDKSQPFTKENTFWASPIERRRYKWTRKPKK